MNDQRAENPIKLPELEKRYQEALGENTRPEAAQSGSPKTVTLEMKEFPLKKGLNIGLTAKTDTGFTIFPIAFKIKLIRPDGKIVLKPA